MMADIKAIQQRVDREIGRRMALHVSGPLPAHLADRIDLIAALEEAEKALAAWMAMSDKQPMMYGYERDLTIDALARIRGK